MSVVTNIIVTTALNDGSLNDDSYTSVDTLNAWLLATRDRPVDQLRLVRDHAGGGKCFECDVWLGAFNHLDIDGFVAAFMAIEWEYRDCAQLMVLEEQRDRFLIVHADGSKPRSWHDDQRYAPDHADEVDNGTVARFLALADSVVTAGDRQQARRVLEDALRAELRARWHP